MARVAGLSLLIVALAHGARAEAWSPFAYVRSLAAVRAAHSLVLDTRPLARCLKDTLAGAHCLPPEALLGPHGRLPAFRQLVWVLGTAGLSGRGTVLVAGERAERRDFVAGLIFLLGQQRVMVLAPPLDKVLRGHTSHGAGIERGMVAQPLFQGAARSALVVLRGELLRALHSQHPPALLDGRSDAQYWGVRLTALRGGHIPGAQSLPVGALEAQAEAGGLRVAPGTVVYDRGPLSSVAYFTLLRAGLGADVRVFPQGWRDWADHTAMPVDAETLPAARTERAPEPMGAPAATATWLALAAASLLLSLAAMAVAMRGKRWT